MEPQFEGQTKTKLGNSETKSAVETLVNEKLAEFLEENPGVGKKIVEKSLRAAEAREAARKARDLARRKNALDSFDLPVNLPTVQSPTPNTAKFISSRVTRRVALQNRDAIEDSRRFFRSKVKSLM